MALFDYKIQAQSGAARAARYETAHGDFTTPMFMPVGTHATVKGVTIGGLHELGYNVLFAHIDPESLKIVQLESKQLGGVESADENAPTLLDAQ